MTFNLSFAGVRVSITPSGGLSSNFLSGVRHCDGRIEADISNFTGTIILTETIDGETKDMVLQPKGGVSNNSESVSNMDNQNHIDTNGSDATASSEIGDEHVLKKDPVTEKYLSNNESSTAIPTYEGSSRDTTSSRMSINGQEEIVSTKEASTLTPFSENKREIPVITNQSQLNGDNIECTSMDNSTRSDSVVSVDGILESLQQPGVYNGQIKVQDPSSMHTNGMDMTDLESTHELSNLTFHEACASEDVNIEELRAMLKSNPKAAQIQDKFGDYPAHIFAKNDAVIYCESSDDDVFEFLFELYCACPRAFSCEGSCGQIPFAGAIVDWIDACHQLYERDNESVYRVSELKTLSRSDKVVNALCVRAEVQLLTRLPDRVVLTPKVLHSFKMLSLLLEKLSDVSFENVSHFLTSWKRRNTIIRSIASLPFILRTILLIESPLERDALLNTTIVKSAAFCSESVGLWIVSLCAGCCKSRNCAMSYLEFISKSCISDLYGKEDASWTFDDVKRFHDSRKELYSAICKLNGILPIMLRLGDRLHDVSLLRPVKYIVESVLGTALVVYTQFSELVCLLLLMLGYRIIIDLLHNSPGESYPEFFGLCFSTGIFFLLKDLFICFGFMTLDIRLIKRHVCHISTMVDWLTTFSHLATLGMMYSDENIVGHNYYGIVAGLLSWKLILHLKGMSSSLSTLVYTILQIAGSLRYFMLVFFILIVGFADMIQIVSKTSGQCDGEPDFETMCALTPVQSYVAMYGLMIGGVDISSVGNFSPLVIFLFIVALFSGLIVMVNILIAIVTSEYEAACEESRALFARARLEQSARFVAAMRFIFPAGLLNEGDIDRRVLIWTKIWGAILFTLFLCQEIFLVRSLVTANTLRQEGILDHSYFITLVLYALLHHLFVAGTVMILSWMAIDHYEHLAWLKGSRFHEWLHCGFVPVGSYLKSIRLYKSEENEEEENEQPLRREDFTKKEEELERKITEAIRESEHRIIMSVFSK